MNRPYAQIRLKGTAAGDRPSSGPSLGEVLARTHARGIGDTSRRAIRRLLRAIDERADLRALDFPLDDGDIVSATNVYYRPPARPGGPLNIGWLCTPPSPGSGGHTTLFRMVRGLEERGHRCAILLYDRHGGMLERHRSVIRTCWPWLKADVLSVPSSLQGFDACVASSWETAHVLAARTPQDCSMAAYYFVQDYEPYFYPRGSLYSLAEDSYRFGFTHLALGSMVAGTLRYEVGVESETVPFGSDLSAYVRTNEGDRSGVVFFVRPDTDRRGYDLGRLALREFHKLHPEQEIHTYGSKARGWGIPLTQHGTLTPADLNELYNRTISGLALSFTNITLVASEMLAAGNLAVLNDHQFARPVLNNSEAVWAPPTPKCLADALGQIVSAPDRVSRSLRAAAQSRQSWSATQAEVAMIITGAS